MTLTVRNSLTDRMEVFEPAEEETITLYYCGLTVSADAHLGHARSWVHVDVMDRWLSHLGYDVRHVENFTDINEKIVARVGEYGDSELAVANRFIERIVRAMRSLNVRRSDAYPRVSEHIPEIIELIDALLERDHAYVANGSVYFDVTTFEDYGRLSNQELAEIEPHEEDRSEKRHPQDFALWKADGVSWADVADHRAADVEDQEAIIDGAETWASPWSKGRPGWHIECSAMSTAHLGETFDIHVAGQDIQFPHNENEIAQAVAGTDGAYARYWLHTGLLRTEGEKMSSSLRNYFTVLDAVDRWGADVIRTFFLSTRYRSEQSFTEAAMEEATERWNRLNRTYRRGIEALESPNAVTKATDRTLVATINESREAFVQSMNDDFNTRKALQALLELAEAVNIHLDNQARYDYPSLHRAIELFETFGGEVFGLNFGLKDRGTASNVDELIELLLEVREMERAADRYEIADMIREELASEGIEIHDTPEGPEFRKGVKQPGRSE